MTTPDAATEALAEEYRPRMVAQIRKAARSKPVRAPKSAHAFMKWLEHGYVIRKARKSG